MSITILNPAITQTIGRSAVAPSWLRGLPGFGNLGGNPSERMGFQNPYTEITPTQSTLQQNGALHNASINIMKKLNKSMAPGPNTQISMDQDQINSISRQRDEILKIDQQQKLARQQHKPAVDGTYKEFKEKIEQQMQQPKSDEIQDIKKKLQRNQMEESKGENDPIYQQVLEERKQLEDKLKKAEAKPQQSEDMPFEDRMQLMTDLRKQRDQATTKEEKDQINEKLKQLRAKPKKQDYTQKIEEIRQNPDNNEPNNNPDGNPDNNDQSDEIKEQLKQAAINRLANIINDPKRDEQEKADAIHQHIQNLDNSEINIIYNVYTQDKAEDAKNNVHGHVDADAILTSLIE